MLPESGNIITDTTEFSIIEPSYPEGFDVETGNDSTFVQYSAMSQLEIPRSESCPEERPSSLLHDTGTMSLILVVFLFVAFSFKRGCKYFTHLGTYMFSVRRRHNLFDDHTVNETQMLAALIANTCVMEGIILYLAISSTQPQLELLPVFRYVGSLSAFALLFYLLQLVLYKVLGYVFLDDKVYVKLLVDGFNASQTLLGLLLLPVAFVMLVYPEMLHFMLICAIFLYIMARIVFICKGFRIFFNNLTSLLYFILYLCSVEIVPVILSIQGTLFLCRILQS